MLGWADRLTGAIAGVITALLAAALIVLPVLAYLPSGERLLRDSVSAPFVTAFADVASKIVPEQLAERYREHIDALRQFWRQRQDTVGSRQSGAFRGTDGTLGSSLQACARAGRESLRVGSVTTSRHL